MSKPEKPSAAVRLTLQDGKPVSVPLSESDAEQLKTAAEVAGASHAALQQRFAELVRQGPPALVLVDRPLSDGAIAEVYLNRSGELRNFMVISRNELNDEIIDRAMGLTRMYQLKHPDDQTPVMFSLQATGEYTRTANDVVYHGQQRFEGHYAKKSRRSVWLLESALRVELTDVPGVGPARVMSLGKPPASSE